LDPYRDYILARWAEGCRNTAQRILTERRADALRAWLEQAARSSLSHLRGFARSLEQDMDAVMNALTYRWSNGRVEGCISKLKLLKRQMYGLTGWDRAAETTIPNDETLRDGWKTPLPHPTTS